MLCCSEFARELLRVLRPGTHSSPREHQFLSLARGLPSLWVCLTHHPPVQQLKWNTLWFLTLLNISIIFPAPSLTLSSVTFMQSQEIPTFLPFRSALEMKFENAFPLVSVETIPVHFVYSVHVNLLTSSHTACKFRVNLEMFATFRPHKTLHSICTYMRSVFSWI